MFNFRSHNSNRVNAVALSITAWLFVFLFAQQSVAQTPLNVWGNNGTSGWVDSVVIDPINPNIVFATGEHGVSKSINYGANWSTSNQGLSPGGGYCWLVIDTQSPNTLYVTDWHADNTMYKTTTGGVNWSPNNFPGRSVWAVAPSNSRIIYALDWTSFLVTKDGGETWNSLPLPEPPLYDPEVFVVDPHDPNMIYTWAQDYDNNLMGLFKSTNGGASWTKLYYPGIASDIQTYALKIDPANTNIIYTTTSFGVYKSTDAGANWTLRDSLQNTSLLALDPLVTGTLYAGVYDAGVYKSTDDGATWSALNNGLTNLRVKDLTIDRAGRFLHAATENGVFSVRIRESAISAKPFDFDGDGSTDISIFRPGTGDWWYLRSKNGVNRTFQFGSSTDKLVPGDYTGDGKTDIAFYRKSTTEWFVLRSEDFSFYSFPFGSAEDIPVPADYDGDGKTDAAVFRPSSNTWFIQNSNGTPTTITTFGVAGDRPVPADYDGDGKADIATYRPGSGQWWLNRSRDGNIVYTFGTGSDKCVPGDYTGDGKADVAFWRPTTGEWFILRSEDSSYYSFPLGNSTDTPSPGDYDGDGKFDAAVFRSSVSTWYIKNSGGIPDTTITQFGVPSDLSVPNSYVR